MTGTASGVMGSYLLDHVYKGDESKIIQVLQGQHIQSEGTVLVHVIRASNERHSVSISGTACLNNTFEVMW